MRGACSRRWSSGCGISRQRTFPSLGSVDRWLAATSEVTAAAARLRLPARSAFSALARSRVLILSPGGAHPLASSRPQVDIITVHLKYRHDNLDALHLPKERPMELFQLRYFLKAAEREGFTRAADELGISQPALSRAIANLEIELGQPVFERQGRRVALTDAGRLLQSRAQQAVALLEEAKNEITDDGESGRLRVAAIPTIAPYFLPGVLREFSRQHPHASVLIQEDVTENALRKCAQGEVDAAILALPVPARHLEIE